jgi:hypothetical protein
VTRLKVFALALAISLASAPAQTLYADDTKADKPLAVQPGDLGGSIVGLDGKTPVKGAKVQLVDKDGKIVAEGSTDETGVFKLGNTPKGEFGLRIGKAFGDLIVKDGVQAKSFKFVLDKDVALGADKAQPQKIAAISTMGAVLLAIAVAIVAFILGLIAGYAVWGARSTKKVFVPVGSSP